MNRLLPCFILVFLFINPSINAQNTQSQNTFSLRLNVPVIMDEIIRKNYIPERMQDVNQEYPDKKTSISIDARTTPLNYASNRFRGTYKNEFFPYNTVSISGSVSPDHMTLEKMTVISNWEVEDEYRKESEDFEMYFENVPMYSGNCFFDKSVSKAVLKKYRYSKTEISKDYYTAINTRAAKAINFEQIPSNPKLATGKFRIQLKMDGPPSYVIDTENVRGPDPDWQPPLFTGSGTQTAFEPGSVGIYENCPPWIAPGSVNTVTWYFLKLPEYKVFERAKIGKLRQEQQLSASGLVKEDAEVKNRLMKEEVALVVNYITENKRLECSVASVAGQKKVQAFNVSEDNYGYVITPFCIEIKKAVDELLKNPEK